MRRVPIRVPFSRRAILAASAALHLDVINAKKGRGFLHFFRKRAVIGQKN